MVKAREVVEALLGQKFELICIQRDFSFNRRFANKGYALLTKNTDPDEEPFRITLFDVHKKPLNHWPLDKPTVQKWSKSTWMEFAYAFTRPGCEIVDIKAREIT